MIKVVAFIFVTLFLYLFFKDKRSDISIFLLLVSGVIVFIFCISKLDEVISFIKVITNKAGIDTFYITIILKILGISYLCTFASEICKDAGASSLGSKVELCGKISILILAIPILMAVLDSILKIL